VATTEIAPEETKEDYVFIFSTDNETKAAAPVEIVPLADDRIAKLHALRTQGSRLDRWDDSLDKYPLLHNFELYTGVRKVYVASVAIAATILLVFFGLGTSVICGLVGFLYPMYMSYKTIEKPTMELLKQWLMYWIVYGIFTMFEHYSDTALSWIPFYHPLKLVFLLWCFLPRYNGATTIFQAFVRPILIKNEALVEESILQAQQAASEITSVMTSQLKDKGLQLGHALRKKSMDFLHNQQQARLAARTPRASRAMPIPEVNENEEGQPSGSRPKVE
jgi:hypothetical protein